VRSAIAGKPVLTIFGAIPTSLSLGVAVAEGEDSLQFDSFIQRADKALYQAKTAGRNCVVLAD
jgi:diguanylate cyclase (GGDEF)-like protein